MGEMDSFEKYAAWEKFDGTRKAFQGYLDAGYVDQGQFGSGVNLMCDQTWAAPGMVLETKSVDEKNTDILVPKSWVVKDSTSIDLSRKHCLRRSLEMTIHKCLEERPDGASILKYEPE